MDDLDPLISYRQKRDFTITPEPAKGGKRKNKHALRFVVQKHWASSLHYDFRLELAGSLKSWAVPKGPSLDPHVKRMAVQVEDHPLSYGDFEGVIPAKQYGAGRVIVWDSGVWVPTMDPAQGFTEGKLKFELRGHKLKGRWTLVRMRGHGEKQVAWLLIKERDEFEKSSVEYDITKALPDSVITSGVRRIEPAKRAVPASLHKNKVSGDQQQISLPAGAVKAIVPLSMAPQLATLGDSPPEQGDWQYELKFDGYRLMTRLDNAAVNCFTRNGHDWTDKLPQLAQCLALFSQAGMAGTWLDGEIVVLNEYGIPDFQLLQKAFEAPIDGGASKAVVYYVFDLPFYRGHDLRGVALAQRRALLEKLLEGEPAGTIRFSAAFDAPLKDLMHSACKLGLEGLIGKRADSLYESRRSPNWIKLKCGKRGAFFICGYTAPKGSRTGFGALLLGQHDDSGQLRYAGNVGAGLSEKTLAELTRNLQDISTTSSPFTGELLIAGKPHWVQPTLVADVTFAELTNSGLIRHGVFRGLLKAANMPVNKIKKSAHNIVAARATSIRSTRIANVNFARPARVSLPSSLQVTHPERIIDAQTRLTKLDVVNHYALVAAVMLPHLKGRPVSLVRAPAGVAGELFFQKHAKGLEIQGIKLLSETLDPGHASLLEIADGAGLLGAAQMNTLEFHTWNGVATSIDKPDRMIFDLDPGEKVTWPEVQEAAMLVRTLLEALGLTPFLKTSGGKGLHVVVPLKKLRDWETVKDFSQAVVQHLAKTIPQKFVAKSGPKNRVGKIFVDYLRNGFGATTVSAWSARARPGLGVSVPMAWDELPQLTSSAHWTIENVAERIAVGNSVWDGYARSACSLSKAMKTLGFKK